MVVDDPDSQDDSLLMCGENMEAHPVSHKLNYLPPGIPVAGD